MPSFQRLISEEEIRQKVAEVAKVLDAVYAGRELTIVMVMKGALCLAADLIRQLKTPCAIEMIQASSYRGATHRGELFIRGIEEMELASKEVLLIDDIYDSGETLSRIVAKIQEKHPKTLKSLVLLSKKVARSSPYIPDHVLFEIDNVFVVGYGLDYNEHYRGLSGIYHMELS
jgi:hypoxanthine phosphoribosyltransferase